MVARRNRRNAVHSPHADTNVYTHSHSYTDPYTHVDQPGYGANTYAHGGQRGGPLCDNNLGIR